jgi:hypothetical protein
MAQPLMPKATAVWLVENTTLTFDQIADFCNLHPLEVQGIADGEVAIGIVGLDPVANGQLTTENLDLCQADSSARLTMREAVVPDAPRRKGPRYTPVSKRGDRPDAVAWLLKYTAEMTDAQICKLVGTTKPTIEAVRSRTHWNTSNIQARDPVLLGICTQGELEEQLARARRRAERQDAVRQKAAKKKRAASGESAAPADSADAPASDESADPPAPKSEATDKPDVGADVDHGETSVPDLPEQL